MKNTTHHFRTPLARDLFGLGAESLKAQEAASKLARLEPEDVEALAFREELYEEARIHRPARRNFHDT